MTLLEAINQLQFDQSMILFDPTTGEEKTLEYVKLFNQDNYNTYVADELAIKALKKQIPKKLDYEGDGFDDLGNLTYDIAFCCDCGYQFEYYYDEHINYCPHCGQALDWSDE